MDDTAQVVLAAIKERRSIRKFTDEPVTRQELLDILEAGRWAPSGRNTQPWRFLALWPDDPRVEPLASLTRYSVIVKAARALIVVVLTKSSMYHAMKDHQGAGACLQSMLLAAHALGLGAVWLGEIVGREPEVLDVLGLQASGFELMAVLAVGRPAVEPEASRLPLSELLLEDI